MCNVSKGYAALLTQRRKAEADLDRINREIRAYVNHHNLNKIPEFPPSDELIERIGQNGDHYEPE